ncbi:JAB domain-containing protein [Sporosarcina sp. FSL K6-5500]|uniref:JAB domain-containing protein n=1 Tax=Sporosarcina sp. FSL K6-5500 TaxID=2921558 RepID=UPI00404688E0
MLGLLLEYLSIKTVHIGSLDSSIVHPHQIPMLTLLINASVIIIVNNRPSSFFHQV